MSELTDALDLTLHEVYIGISDLDVSDAEAIIREAARLWSEHQGKCPLLISAIEDPDYILPWNTEPAR